MKNIYLDHAATTPVAPDVLEAMQPYFCDTYGNPSSLHLYGQRAKAAVDDARRTVAGAVGAQPDEIIFTSGGTEANNLALIGMARANQDKGKHIITSAIEHQAVLSPCRYLEQQGFSVTYVGVDECGRVDPAAVKKAITEDTILISIMHANNEIGTIQPVAAIARYAREKNILMHTDAVQTFGHIPVDVASLGIDALSLSAHKLYGPKGVGALYLKRGACCEPLLWGGHQEIDRRSGTENVAGIVGFGKAVSVAVVCRDEEVREQTRLRDMLIAGLIEKIPHARLNGHSTERLPNNVNIAMIFVDGEALLINLDAEGIAASTGSACSSATVEPSHVLRAIGLSDDMIHGALRFSLGRGTTEQDIQIVLETLPGLVERLRSLSPLYTKMRDD